MRPLTRPIPAPPPPTVKKWAGGAPMMIRCHNRCDNSAPRYLYKCDPRKEIRPTWAIIASTVPFSQGVAFLSATGRCPHRFPELGRRGYGCGRFGVRLAVLRIFSSFA